MEQINLTDAQIKLAVWLLSVFGITHTYIYIDTVSYVQCTYAHEKLINYRCMYHYWELYYTVGYFQGLQFFGLEI